LTSRDKSEELALSERQSIKFMALSEVDDLHPVIVVAIEVFTQIPHFEGQSRECCGALLYYRVNGAILPIRFQWRHA